jgi:hypothetical protein
LVRTTLPLETTGDSSLKMVEKRRALGRTHFIVGVTGLFDRLSISCSILKCWLLNTLFSGETNFLFTKPKVNRSGRIPGC